MFQVWSNKKTHPGRKRSNNEDYVDSFEPTNEEDLRKSGRLYIVADGVGGASKGEKASKFATEKVLFEYYRMPDIPPEERLRTLFRQASDEIHDFAKDSSSFMRMATTMVAAVVIGDQLIVANAGDSKAFLIRDGVAFQLTDDHSIVAENIRNGAMTKEEARQSRIRNKITRSLGGKDHVKVDIFKYQLQVGDKVLLSSDGFSQYAASNCFNVEDRSDTVVKLVAEGAPDEITPRLINYANSGGGSDNISVILLEIFPEDFVVPTGPRKGELTEPDSLENMATTPGFEDVRPGLKEALQNPWFYLGGGAVISIVFLLSALIILLSNPNVAYDRSFLERNRSATPSTEPSSTPIFEDSEANPDKGGNAPLSIDLNPILTIDPERSPYEYEIIPKPTNEPASPDNQNQDPEPTKDPNQLITCGYQLTREDRMDWPSGAQVDLLKFVYNTLNNQSDEYNPFDGSREGFEVYALGISCADRATCNYMPGSFNADIDQVLVFPRIKRIDCLDASGFEVEIGQNISFINRGG